MITTDPQSPHAKPSLLVYASIRSASLLACAAIFCFGLTFPSPAQAQATPVVVVPDAVSEAEPIADPASASEEPPDTPSPEEIAELKAQYESLSEDEQAEMKAYYADMDIDLDELLGIAAERMAQMTRAQQITMAMAQLNFAREPSAVLGARSRLGFGQVPYPNVQTAPPADISKWIHEHVLAGEWGAYATFLQSCAETEAEAIYTFVMQGMARGDAGLLPEEVLAFAEASPTDFKPWQMKILGDMLASATDKNSKGQMLEQIGRGTRLFGDQDDATRRRTIEFLSAGGLVREAYAYLPTLEQARADQDGELLLVHARYKDALADAAFAGPAREALKHEAWAIDCEVALLPNETFETRRAGLTQAIESMSDVPSARVRPWLTEVFADDAIGPTALEIMALTAVSIGDSNLDVEQRALSVLTLKEGVDILLAREQIDSSSLRIPLRMLTTALAAEMEAAVTKQGRQSVLAREAQLLLRAVPNERWLSALEPSLATRVRKASIGIATLADETDMALALLERAIEDAPDEAVDLADHFLTSWEKRLNPTQNQNDNIQFYYFYREFLPMAPLTRGRQRRNLDRLDRLMETLAAIGVESRSLPAIVPTFKACHAKTEVYAKEDIERVFGKLDTIPAATSSGLAMTMGASLNGDWRSRTVQRSTGTKRTDSEIAQLVDKGYALALELVSAAIANEPEAWKLSVLRASLTYDRMQFNQSRGRSIEASKQNDLHRAAFEAFAQAADRYSTAITTGQERDDPSIYHRWFGAAMGTAELNFLREDDLPKEGTIQDDQIDMIGASMRTLPPEALDRHLAVFAAGIQSAIGRAEPTVKPRLVKHALRIIGDHSAGATLRSMEELYHDLVRDEIKLRITLDGDDQIGVNEPFGILVALRFTNSVDRETGGFAKYLQNNVWARVGNQYRPVNYRDQLEKAIEKSLSKNFIVESIGYFDPFMPPRGVVEAGDDGWLEKPMAYVILTRHDASIDRLDQVVIEMQFTDQTGAVTLALPSNTVLLEASTARSQRPAKELAITQLVDTRAINEGADDNTVTLEVQVRGQGVLPGLDEILDGIENALPGYSLADGAIEAPPLIIFQEGDIQQSNFGWRNSGPTEPEDGYPEPDETGMYRLDVERTFTVSYTRSQGAIGSAFTLPVLRAGVDATLDSRAYSDLDIEPVLGSSVRLSPPFWTAMRLGAAATVAAIFVVLAVLVRRRSPKESPAGDADLSPAKMTPLGVITLLRRYRSAHADRLDNERLRALELDIGDLELKYFGPQAQPQDEGDLRTVVAKWESTAGR